MKTPSFLHPARQTTRRRGFTLFEMLLVLTIIGLLMGLVIYNLGHVADDAKMERAHADILTLREALSAYQMTCGMLPTTEQGLKALWSRPTSEPLPQNWSKQMDAETKDPWGNSYQYVNPGKHNPDGYDLYSMGPSGQPDAPDAIGNWTTVSTNQ
ncbi:MAG TPA: type II secretion system major pseudopilin GspG [Candidatus Methylacidiphilales bacterium]|nr:type II secretion system major pseudopilin GspG [Candidatus Methylacidiphilales bacterium]